MRASRALAILYLGCLARSTAAFCLRVGALGVGTIGVGNPDTLRRRPDTSRRRPGAAVVLNENNSNDAFMAFIKRGGLVKQEDMKPRNRNAERAPMQYEVDSQNRGLALISVVLLINA